MEGCCDCGGGLLDVDEERGLFWPFRKSLCIEDKEVFEEELQHCKIPLEASKNRMSSTGL